MKINSKHYILVIFALGSVALAGFGYWHVYRIVIKQAEINSESLQAVESEKGRTQREQDLAKTHAETLDDRARLPAFIVSEDKVVDLIESIESVASSSDSEVTLSSIATEKSHFKGRIEIKGSWSNAMRALILIENLPYSISFNNLKLSHESESKKWSILFDMQVLTKK